MEKDIQYTDMVNQSQKSISERLNHYPAALWSALRDIAEDRDDSFFLTGGTVRDFLLGREPVDIDLTVKKDAILCCRHLISRLGDGTFVPLGRRQEECARVVWQGLSIDFSAFRSGAATIEEDLRKRDYTINSMAIDLTPYLSGAKSEAQLIDPLSAEKDLNNGVLQSLPEAFDDDPLRLLRGYRFEATLGFRLSKETREEINRKISLIENVSPERILYELDCIMSADNSHPVIREMADSGLLFQVIPELKQGVGVDQPGFHHLDVFHHNLEALKQIEKIIREPSRYYPEQEELLSNYLLDTSKKNALKWAALFHDLGKPATKAAHPQKTSRVTFYGHDREGCALFEQISQRLKWSNQNRAIVSGLIYGHMHPFHLSTILRTGKLSKRSCLKLYKRAGDHLAGLFLLAMADSLAGQGELKPAGMEDDLVHLFTKVMNVYNQDIRPTLTGPKLVNGHDLIELFDLHPSPVFSTILDELEVAQVEGEVSTRSEALNWIDRFLKENSSMNLNDTAKI